MRNLFVFFILFALLASGCVESEPISEMNGTGKLSVKITDAPFPIEIIESAEVTFYKAEIYEQYEDSTLKYLLFEDTVTLNILDLQNGITEELAEVEIPAGDYFHMRLYVVDASITLTGYGTFDMKVPSGPQSGIKIFIDPAVKVRSGLTSELLLDFDLSRSFVMKGNMYTPAGIKGFNFKPVIRAVNNSVAGSIEGFVSDTTGTFIEDAYVWMEKDTVVASAFSNEEGYYSIIGIPAGDYMLWTAAEGYDTIQSEVTITEANLLQKDIVLKPSGQDDDEDGDTGDNG